MCCGASTQIFTSDFHLSRFLSGEEALKRIEHYNAPNQSLYFGRWSVVWITVKAPFEWVISYIAYCGAHLAYVCGLQKLERICTVFSYQMLRDSKQLAHQNEWGEKLLVPSFGWHETCTWDLYGLGSYERSAIQSGKLRACLFPTEVARDLRLYSPKGGCRGMSYYFVKLFLQSGNLKAVAEEFRRGVPKEATLLQGTFDNTQLLGLSEVDLGTEEREIEELPPGVYILGTLTHSMVYIHLEDRNSFLFDPAIGLLKLTPEEIKDHVAPKFFQCFKRENAG